MSFWEGISPFYFGVVSCLITFVAYPYPCYGVCPGVLVTLLNLTEGLQLTSVTGASSPVPPRLPPLVWDVWTGLTVTLQCVWCPCGPVTTTLCTEAELFAEWLRKEVSPGLPSFRLPVKHKDEWYLKDASLGLLLYQKPREVQPLVRRQTVAVRWRHKWEILQITGEEWGKYERAAITTGHVMSVAFIVLKNLKCSSFQTRFKIRSWICCLFGWVWGFLQTDYLEGKKRTKRASWKSGVDFDLLKLQRKRQIFFVQIHLLSKMASLSELGHKPRGL